MATDPHQSVYLGDGVYAVMDADQRIVLTTGHHLIVRADNVIFLEPSVAVNLVKWIESFVEKE